MRDRGGHQEGDRGREPADRRIGVAAGDRLDLVGELPGNRLAPLDEGLAVPGELRPFLVGLEEAGLPVAVVVEGGGDGTAQLVEDGGHGGDVLLTAGLKVGGVPVGAPPGPVGENARDLRLQLQPLPDLGEPVEHLPGRRLVGGRGEPALQTFGVHPGQAALVEGAAAEDDLLVQPGALVPGDDDAHVRHHGGRGDQVRGHDPGGDPCQLRTPADPGCPQLGAEQVQAHLDQAAAEVEQDHVGPVGRRVLVEGDHPLRVRDRVQQPVVAGLRPRAGQRGQPEAARFQPLGRVGVEQVPVVGQPERGADHPLHRLRGEVQLRPAAA